MLTPRTTSLLMRAHRTTWLRVGRGRENGRGLKGMVMLGQHSFSAAVGPCWGGWESLDVSIPPRACVAIRTCLRSDTLTALAPDAICQPTAASLAVQVFVTCVGRPEVGSRGYHLCILGWVRTRAPTIETSSSRESRLAAQTHCAFALLRGSSCLATLASHNFEPVRRPSRNLPGRLRRANIECRIIQHIRTLNVEQRASSGEVSGRPCACTGG